MVGTELEPVANYLPPLRMRQNVKYLVKWIQLPSACYYMLLTNVDGRLLINFIEQQGAFRQTLLATCNTKLLLPFNI